VIDVSNPAAPVALAAFDSGRFLDDVEVADGRAYLLTDDVGGSRLRVLDVSDPGAPLEIGALEGFDSAGDLEVVGGLAYVGDESGVRLIDVSNPAAPVEVSRLGMTLRDEADVEVVGGLAYVASGFSWLQVIDVSTPAIPRALGVLASHGEALAVEVAGGLA
jgi:hypothetical protein